jgi:hypothetical protein
VARQESEQVLNKEDLEEFTRRLSLLSTPSVEGVYNTAHKDCLYDGKHLPPAAAVQQLVAAWKVLRKMQRLR